MESVINTLEDSVREIDLSILENLFTFKTFTHSYDKHIRRKKEL